MDQNKKHYIQSVRKLSQVHFLKKTIKILVSISVFILIFIQPSLFDGLLNYFDYCVSALSIKFFDYNSERNYIFLLFNGILALIIKNSGLITNFQENSRSADAELPKRKTEAIEEGGKQNGDLVTVKADEEEEEENENDYIPENYQIPGDEEVEEEEEEIDLLSAEELNKKCDDFIKKMRDGIRFDLLQPNLVVTMS